MHIRNLQAINAARAVEWHAPQNAPWTLGDWGNAMAGECGEACNVIKKIRRIECGLKPPDNLEALREHLAEELADTLLYLLLVAEAADLDMQAAVRDKFNSVSGKEGFPQRL